MGLATVETADADLEARTDEGEDSSAPFDGCIPCRIPFRISSSSPIPEERHIPLPPDYEPASDDRRYTGRIPPVPSVPPSPLHRSRIPLPPQDKYAEPIPLSRSRIPLPSPLPEHRRGRASKTNYTARVYNSPWVSVTSLHQMDGEFSFLQRLAEYGMISHLAYKTGSVTRGETETPPSVGGFAVQRGGRLTDFYAVMTAAVQHNVPFAYHFSLECRANT